jgi:hypothetical protein
MKSTSAKILLLLLSMSLSCSAAPPMLYDADVKAPLLSRPIHLSEGTTPLLRFRLLNNNALVVVTNYTGTLYLSETWDSDSVITIPSTAVGTNHLDFQLTTGHTATNGTFRASLVVASASETVEWARGVVELAPNPALSGADTLDITNPFAFAGLTFSGVSSDGPYKAGSGISFSAPDGRGRVTVNASLDVADLSDVDTTGRSAGEVVSWNGTNYVHEAQGGHDPATVTGGILTISGQQIGLSTNDVVLAIVGQTVTGKDFVATESLKSPLLTSEELSGLTISTTDGDIYITSQAGAGNIIFSGTLSGIGSGLTNIASTNLVGTILAARLPQFTGGDVTTASAGSASLTIGNSTVTSAKIVDGTIVGADLADAQRTIAFHAGTWEGPTVSQTPGWAPKSYAVAGLNAVVAGPVGSATQAAGTFASIFQVPSDATAWRTNKAISISFIGDSTTSTAVKYRLRVYVAGNNTALYDVSDQVLASTSTITTVDIAASSLGSCTADAVYTIVVDASVTTSGMYFVGTPRVQVIK